MIKKATVIQSEIEALRVKFDNWNAVQNEGARDGFNPFTAEIEAKAEELRAAQAAESPLTSDLAGERARFNAQGFTSPAVANAACLKRGYRLDDLISATKSA